jgi:prepilin peptidase CpaA
MQIFIWFGSLVLVIWAGVTDWQSRRIPNWMTVPGFFLGLVFNAAFWNWPGVKASLQGAGLGLGLLLPFVLMRGLGAGDWKLMGALGAWLGPSNVILALLGTVFVTGLMAIVQVLRHGRLKETLVNMGSLILTFATFGIRSTRVTLDNPGLLKLPFGVAAAVATTLLFIAEWSHRFF